MHSQQTKQSNTPLHGGDGGKRTYQRSTDAHKVSKALLRVCLCTTPTLDIKEDTAER